MKNRIWLHTLWWLSVYAFWIMVFQRREFSFSRTVTIEFCYLFFIATNYYVNFQYSIPRFLYKRKYLTFAGIFLAGILISAMLRVPLATFLNKHYFIPAQIQPRPAQLFFNSILNISIWVTCLVAGKLIIDRFRFQNYVDEVTQHRKQAELELLNAQFNPHFLFNSINSIYGHIDKSNGTARKMLLTFSDMLRYQLYECGGNETDIEKEINYIRNYVLLQKSRRDESLAVSLEIDDTISGFRIAPLLFVTYIENSFKYVGNDTDRENAVLISMTREQEIVKFRCFNTKHANGTNQMERRGIGLTNAKKRLELLYPEKYALNIIEEPTFFEVNLNITIK